jgi:hypothetical protein
MFAGVEHKSENDAAKQFLTCVAFESGNGSVLSPQSLQICGLLLPSRLKYPLTKIPADFKASQL